MFWRVVLFILFLPITSGITLATPGNLDTTFNPPNGFVLYNSGTEDEGSGIAIQPDDKIVVVGVKNNGPDSDFLLLRYNPDGTLDTSFGSNGIVAYDGGARERGFGVAIQPDGKIVAVGITNSGWHITDFLTLRYNPDGSLDTTFGSGGVVVFDFYGVDDYGQDVAIQSDGKIVVVGMINNQSNYDPGIVRYNPDGSLDTTFGSYGVITEDCGRDDTAKGIAIQPDGKIVIVGQCHNGTDSDLVVFRYNPDGSRDTSFGIYGQALYNNGIWDTGRDVTIQEDGKIVVVGEGYNDRGWISESGRWTFTNGEYSGLSGWSDTYGQFDTVAISTLDSSLTTDGMVIEVDFSFFPEGGSENAYIIFDYQSPTDYKYVSARGIDITSWSIGYGEDKSTFEEPIEISHWYRMRVVISGTKVTLYVDDLEDSPDAGFVYKTEYTFSSIGSGKVGLATRNAYAHFDNFLIDAGALYTFSDDFNNNLLILRYNPDGWLDTTFGSDGVVIYNGGFNESSYGVALQEDGKIVVVGESNNGTETDLLILRYNPDGSLDTTFGSNGTVIFDGGSDDKGRDVVLQSDSKIVATGLSSNGTDYDVLTLRFISAQLLDTDNDGILDDGDSSGISGDNTCTGGNTINCDDNCIDIPNPDQGDADSDGIGDVCDMCPDDPEQNCAFLDDFNDGDDSGWSHISETWLVENGEYSGYPDSDVAVSILNFSRTTANTIIEVDYSSQPDTNAKNGFIIFDYQSPTDFKYAGVWEGSDMWKIGYRDSKGFHNMASYVEPIYTSHRYRIKVVIEGTTVTLYVDDLEDSPDAGFVYKTEYTFSSIDNGMIGLGTNNSHAHFDNFSVAPPPVSSYIYSDNFNDGNADGWSEETGPEFGWWSVENGQYSGLSDWNVYKAISVVNSSQTTCSTVIEADFSFQSDSADRNVYIIFDYQSPTEYKYVRAKGTGTNWWSIGYGGDNVRAYETIETSHWYRMRVVINGTKVTLYVDDLEDSPDAGFVYKTEYTFSSIGNGKIGFATHETHAHFDNLLINSQWCLSDNFNDGNADGWSEETGPEFGWWSVENGQYSGLSEWPRYKVISTLNSAITTNNTVIEADFSFQSDSADRNVYIIFDYQSSTEYKYVRAKGTGTNWWSIGYGGDNVRAYETIETSHWYRMRVVINGTKVTLYVDDLEDSPDAGFVYKTEYTFSSIGNGKIGFATHETHAHFDNFILK